MKAFREIKEAVDKTTVNELVIYITNDAQLYRQRTQAIIKNLSKKVGGATYDGLKAIKAFMYLVTDGIKKYEKEHASPGWAKSIDKKTKEAIAEKLLDYYTDEIGEEKKVDEGVKGGGYVTMSKTKNLYETIKEIAISEGSDQTFDFEFDEDEIRDAIELLNKHKLKFELYSGETEALEVTGDPKKVLAWAKKVDPDTYKRYSTKDLEDKNGA